MVNITDFENEKWIPENIWTEIFNYQNDLMEEYHRIESINQVGYYHVRDIPFDLDHPRWQEMIKQLTFRILEEVAESMAAHSEEHYAEELIDALHFAVELMIVLSYRVPEKMEDYKPDKAYPRYYMQSWVFKHYGLAANCLKNKPWKQTFQPTDEKQFRNRIIFGFRALYILLREVMSDEQIYLVYVKKMKVNQFRQKSKY